MSPACDRSTYTEYFNNFEFFDGLLCTVDGEVGLVLFTGMVYSILLGSLYYWTGSVAVTFVVMVLTAGAFVALLPAGVMQLIGIVVLLAITLSGIGIIKRLEVDV